ncbi:hypothetical protein FRY98_19545 [Paenibacillus faecis]|uniref:Uncharacterized protein n=1 Tax=Paenibacillus faecis TaxID=862114 RepID=A0A5D0CN86_9BACL|nr:hypothetical protein [Paenibacillus faecis]TYA11351.1 hypothetical protein FRY98_19545 [Paenibacillus faecis]
MALVFDSLTFRVYEPSMLDSPPPPLPIAITGLTSMPLLILSMVLFPVCVLRTQISDMARQDADLAA